MKKLSSPQFNMYQAMKFYGEDYPVNIGGILHLYLNQDTDSIKNCLRFVFDQAETLHTKISMDGQEVRQYIERKPYAIDDFDFKENWDQGLLQSYFEKPFILDEQLFRLGVIEGKEHQAVIIVVHHLIFDSWSSQLLVWNILNQIAGMSIPQNGSYQQFLERESQYEQSTAFQKDRLYWQEECRHHQATMAKPMFISRSLDDTHHETYCFSRQQTKTIDAFCQQNNVSAATLIETALALDLAYINASTSVTLGTTTLNRKTDERNIMGMFVSTLPVIIEINPNQTLVDLVKSIQTKHYQLYRHQQYPYQRILNHFRDDAYKQLFDVMVILHKSIKQEYPFDFRLETLYQAKNELSILINVEKRTPQDFYKISADFKKSLFQTEVETKAFMKRLCRILDQILDYPDQHVQTVIIEDQLPISEHENTVIDATILTIFKNRVASFPKRLACSENSRQTTYLELDVLSDLIAAKLRHLGFDRAVIAIDLPTQTQSIQALLGVLKANCSYTFLPPDLNLQIKEEYLKIAGAIYTIHQDFFSDLAVYSFTGIERSNPILAVYFTSGTTGAAKGVYLKDQSLLHYVMQKQGYPFEARRIKTILNLTQLHFDISLECIFLALMHGKTLILEALESMQNVQDEQIDLISTTPSVFQYLLEIESLQKVIQKSKIIVLGGEVLGQNLVAAIREISNAKIYNSYGPTETTIAVTSKLIINHEMTLGKPFHGCDITIMNENHQPLPKLYAGEIWISGICLSAGYTDANQGGFITIGSKRYYMTGDYGYIDQNNELHFLGRKDRQIKKNGVRIELDRIDQILMQHASIKQAHSVWSEKRIYTYCVRRHHITTGDLFAYLKQFLLPQHLPNQLLFVHSIPLSSQGKMVIKPQPTGNLKNVFVPQNQAEEIFADTLRSMTHVDVFYEGDTFYDLGADSLDALAFLIQLENRGVHLSMKDFYETPHLTELALLINKKKERQILDFQTLAPLDFYHQKVNETAPKQILLLGSTGYLGAHILRELLVRTKADVHLLVRSHSSATAVDYFNEVMAFYFGESIDKTRIKIYEADITQVDFGLSKQAYESIIGQVDTIINAAAKVDYLGDAKIYEQINFRLVERLTELARIKDIRLFHCSTIGMALLEQQVFDEKTLYQHTVYDTYYLESKSQAEYALLQAKKNEVPVYILRIGNLMPRRCDEKFQRNPERNAFYQLTKGVLGGNPNQSYYFDFSPVDEIAGAIATLVQHPPKLCVLHLYHPGFYAGLNCEPAKQHHLDNQETRSILAAHRIQLKSIGAKQIVKIVKKWQENR